MVLFFLFILLIFYFFYRALLYGGMRESQPQAEVRLEDTRVDAFSMLLRYLYTGRASLSDAKDETLLDFLGLAHRYGLQPLEESTCDYLRTLLNTQNVSLIFDVASLYNLSSLAEACCAFMDQHAVEVLKSDSFLALSKVRATSPFSEICNHSYQPTSRMRYAVMSHYYDNHQIFRIQTD